MSHHFLEINSHQEFSSLKLPEAILDSDLILSAMVVICKYSKNPVFVVFDGILMYLTVLGPGIPRARKFSSISRWLLTGNCCCRCEKSQTLPSSAVVEGNATSEKQVPQCCFVVVNWRQPFYSRCITLLCWRKPLCSRLGFALTTITSDLQQKQQTGPKHRGPCHQTAVTKRRPQNGSRQITTAKQHWRDPFRTRAITVDSQRQNWDSFCGFPQQFPVSNQGETEKKLRADGVPRPGTVEYITSNFFKF